MTAAPAKTRLTGRSVKLPPPGVGEVLSDMSENADPRPTVGDPAHGDEHVIELD